MQASLQQQQRHKKNIAVLNDKSVASLWLDMLKFYSLDFVKEWNYVSIIEKGILSKDASWKSKKLAIQGKTKETNTLI